LLTLGTKILFLTPSSSGYVPAPAASYAKTIAFKRCSLKGLLQLIQDNFAVKSIWISQPSKKPVRLGVISRANGFFVAVQYRKKKVAKKVGCQKRKKS